MATNPRKKSRPESRAGVLNYKSANPAHGDALREAAASLEMPLTSLFETALDHYVTSRGLPPLPPRTQGRYRTA